MERKKSRSKPKTTLKRERFVDNYLANGGNATQAAQTAGYKHPNKQGPRLLVNVGIQERISARCESAANLTANEVIGTLASQMRGDITDVLDGRGSLDLGLVRELGLGHLIKSLVIKSYKEPGSKGKAVEITRVEFHSSQAAAVQLCKVLGLEQEARDNERNARIRQRVLRAIDRLAAKHNITPEHAKDLYLRMAPEHSKYLN